MLIWRRVATAFLLATGVGCPSTPASRAPLIVTPETATVRVGGSPVTFTTSGAANPNSVVWSLSSEGMGSLSAASGASVTYAPPRVIPSASTVTITARAEDVTGHAGITVEPAMPLVEVLALTAPTGELAVKDGEV